MEAVGIVRKLDQLGRVVVPVEIRRQHGIKDGDSVEILPTMDGIIIRRYAEGKNVQRCIDALRNAIRECDDLEPMRRPEALQHVAALKEAMEEMLKVKAE